MNISKPARIAIIAALTIVTAVALISLERRIESYMLLPTSLAPVSEPTRYAGGPALSMLPLRHTGYHNDSRPPPPNPFKDVDFGAQIRTLSYRATFIASEAMEGADGNLYIAYYWAPPVGTAYDPDKFGVVTGGVIREVVSGMFLDLVTITGRAHGYPTFSISTGTTPTEDDLHGNWVVAATGPHQLSWIEPLSPTCVPCDGSLIVGKGHCFSFAAGQLCQQNQQVTFWRNDRAVVVIPAARVIGAGPHRFLVGAPEADNVGEWNLEGFAP
ncbi:MAG: hypothetical protein M3Z37_03925 [Candidatus Eremiobacteraeota bacterium]|nr:hypothetical protein [Candidatus Eremiobacteraeota bacterium]